jgi:acetoin utilization deacetylase AcuC-like enzyme
VHGPGSLIDIGAHVFPIDKYRILERLVREELGVEEDRLHGWDEVEDEDLDRVHTPRYLDDLAHARTTRDTLTSELPVTAEVIDGFRRMVGGSIAAVRLALEKGVGFHLGGGFHHAFPDHAEGFCYLHDVAIAVERLRAETDLDRVLIVDTDLHQGNGTAVIYQGDAATFTYSIHQENNYPIKQRSDLDRGLPDGIEDDDYLSWLGTDLTAIDEAFEPDLVCYVAGVDPYVDDQLGGLCLTPSGLAARDALVLSRYVGRGIPVAVFTAGGYAPAAETTARLHLATARVAEEVCRPRDPV